MYPTNNYSRRRRSGVASIKCRSDRLAKSTREPKRIKWQRRGSETICGNKFSRDSPNAATIDKYSGGKVVRWKFVPLIAPPCWFANVHQNEAPVVETTTAVISHLDVIPLSASYMHSDALWPCRDITPA